MQKRSIDRRIAALEDVFCDTLPRTIVVFHNLDGTVQHGETVYPDLAAAQAANTGYDLWVVIECQDMSAKS